MLPTAQNTDGKPIRVAFYRRVSTREQDVDGFSLDGQLHDLQRYTELKSYKNWMTKSEWDFAEQASGAEKTRPELDKLLRLVKRKEVDVVLVWKIDRMARSLPLLLDIFEVLHKNEVGFASVKEDVDFSGIIGRLIFQLFGAIAEFERENIRLRTAEGKKTSARAGNWIGGSAPYGFRKVKNKREDGKDAKGSKLHLIPEEAEWVKQIFTWFVHDRKCFAEIAKELNAQGVSRGEAATSRVRGKPWIDTNIREILENDMYRGVYIANRFQIVSQKPRRVRERPREEWITSSVAPTVDDILFIRAQQHIREEDFGRPGGSKESYLLQGKLIDQHSGKGFVGYKSAKGTKNYRRKKCQDALGNELPTISIAAKELEKFVWSRLQTAITDPERFLEAYKREQPIAEEIKRVQAELVVLEKEFSKANRRIELVKQDYYDEKIESDERDALLAKYEPQRDTLFTKKLSLEKELHALVAYEAAAVDVVKFADSLGRNIDLVTFAQKKMLIQLVVDRIVVTETEDRRTARVCFRFDLDAAVQGLGEGRTILLSDSNENTVRGTENIQDGGQQSQGYTFSFATTLAYRNPKTGNFRMRNQHFANRSDQNHKW